MTAPSAQPWPSKPAPAVRYIDPETLQERRSGTLRLRRQCKFYRDDPRAPLEPWPGEPDPWAGVPVWPPSPRADRATVARLRAERAGAAD